MFAQLLSRIKADEVHSASNNPNTAHTIAEKYVTLAIHSFRESESERRWIRVKMALPVAQIVQAQHMPSNSPATRSRKSMPDSVTVILGYSWFSLLFLYHKNDLSKSGQDERHIVRQSSHWMRHFFNCFP